MLRVNFFIELGVTTYYKSWNGNFDGESHEHFGMSDSPSFFFFEYGEMAILRGTIEIDKIEKYI